MIREEEEEGLSWLVLLWRLLDESPGSESREEERGVYLRGIEEEEEEEEGNLARSGAEAAAGELGVWVKTSFMIRKFLDFHEIFISLPHLFCASGVYQMVDQQQVCSCVIVVLHIIQFRLPVLLQAARESVNVAPYSSA